MKINTERKYPATTSPKTKERLPIISFIFLMSPLSVWEGLRTGREMTCGASHQRGHEPSLVFVHCFLLSFVSPSFTQLVLENRPEKTAIHPSSAPSMWAASVLLYVPNLIYLQHDQQSGKWSPISSDIITHGSSLRPHSVQLSMAPEPNHLSLPSYCVCMSDVAKSQQITLVVSLSPPLGSFLVHSFQLIFKSSFNHTYAFGEFHLCK